MDKNNKYWTETAAKKVRSDGGTDTKEHVWGSSPLEKSGMQGGYYYQWFVDHALSMLNHKDSDPEDTIACFAGHT